VEGGKEEKKRGREVRSERARPSTAEDVRDASSSLSFLRSCPLLARTSAILSLSGSLSLYVYTSPLSLSLLYCGDLVLQVVRPPIGGRGRRCAWVGEAWYPPPIGYRVLPTPEVGRRCRKEDRNEGGQKLKAAPPLELKPRGQKQYRISRATPQKPARWHFALP